MLSFNKVNYVQLSCGSTLKEKHVGIVLFWLAAPSTFPARHRTKRFNWTLGSEWFYPQTQFRDMKTSRCVALWNWHSASAKKHKLAVVWRWWLLPLLISYSENKFITEPYFQSWTVMSAWRIINDRIEEQNWRAELESQRLLKKPGIGLRLEMENGLRSMLQLQLSVMRWDFIQPGSPQTTGFNKADLTPHALALSHFVCSLDSIITRFKHTHTH